MANFALWVGLMMGRPIEFDDMPSVMDFKEVKSNFIKAARMGRDAIMKWKGTPISIEKLMQQELLPMAHAGLIKAGINDEDRIQLLGIIEDRLKLQTGSEWVVKNYRMLKETVKADNALRLITRAMYKNEKNNLPIHKWPPIEKDGYLKQESHLVRHIMTTEIFTVNENDLATLATELMKWKNIHHMPVENGEGKLTGLLTWTHAQKFQKQPIENTPLTVADIMEKDIRTAIPETHITDAIRTMKKHEIGCLPVARNRDLIGIITIKDVIPFDYE